MSPLARHAQLRVGAVRELPSGEIAITKTQRNIHVLFEGLAVFAVAPLTAYIAYSNPFLKPWQRGFLYTVAAGTILVDGGLLLSYARKKV